MQVYVSISNVGTDAGPFNLYSDVDGYSSAFESNIAKSILEAGLTSLLAPDGTATVRIKSVNPYCSNYIDINIPRVEGCDMILQLEKGPYVYSPSPRRLEPIYIPDYVYGYDIASTENKFWELHEPLYIGPIYGTYETEIWEYDIISDNPFQTKFNRIITFPFYVGAGLCAIDDTTLVVVDEKGYYWSNDSYVILPSIVYSCDISGASPSLTNMFELETTVPNEQVMRVSGDIIYTSGVSPKIIITCTEIFAGEWPNYDNWLLQYDWNTGSLEVKKNLYPDINIQEPYGLAVKDSNLYLFNSADLMYTDIYTVDLVSPFNLTLVERLNTGITGASQRPSCIDVKLVKPPFVDGCDILLFGLDSIYVYNPGPRRVEALPIPDFTPGTDIASTENKLWTTGYLQSFTKPGDPLDYNFIIIKEYDITYSPWTATFNRDIRIETSVGGGICAIDDTTLVIVDEGREWWTHRPSTVQTVDISGPTPVFTDKIYIPLGTSGEIWLIAGDVLLTEGLNPKFLATFTKYGDYSVSILRQYDFNTGVLEIEVDTTSIPNPYGLASLNGKLYIFSIATFIAPTDVYEVDLNFPYTTTLVDTIADVTMLGASQKPSCIDVELAPLECEPFVVDAVIDEIYYFTFTGNAECPSSGTITFINPITVYLRESEITGVIGAQSFLLYDDSEATIPSSGTELDTLTSGVLIIQDHNFPYAFDCVASDGTYGGTGPCGECR